MEISQFRAEGQRELAFGSIVAGYTAIGTPIFNPGTKIMVQNLTDALLQFSFDSELPHFPLPANGYILLDVPVDTLTSPNITVGTTVYVKRIDTPTTGKVYVSAFYAKRK